MITNNELNGCTENGFEASAVDTLLNQIGLNEIAAGTLNKAVDTAAAVTQFTVGAVTGVGCITLDSVNRLVATGTEALNTQFSSMVNRIFGVKKC